MSCRHNGAHKKFITPQMTLEDDKALAALAVAMVQNPRGTYQDLAAAVGVSRATLYRFCRTREELILRLLRHSSRRLTDGLEDAQLEAGEPKQGLDRLIESHLKHKELVSFITQYWQADSELDPEMAADWKRNEEAIDAFFLRGQRAGVFRIDISASALNDTLVWLIIGLTDCERRGRIAGAALRGTIADLFMAGARAE